MPHKNRTAGALHILTLISIFFGSVQIAAQSPEAPTYRVQSELVLVDLLASDSAGNRITNLAKKDIEIREDGKKQKIEYFEFLTSRPPDRPQPWTSTEFASPNDQIRLVILVDLGSIRAQGWAQARKSLSQFLLNDLPKGSQVMLATFRTSLSILHPLSTDTQSIVGALEEIEAAVDPGATIATFDSFMKQLADSTRGAISTEDAASAASTTMRNFLDLLEGQMGRLTASLGAISQLLGP